MFLLSKRNEKFNKNSKFIKKSKSLIGIYPGEGQKQSQKDQNCSS